MVEKPGADFKLTPIILDEVRGNEVLVEMKYSGICHTVSVNVQGYIVQSVIGLSDHYAHPGPWRVEENSQMCGKTRHQCERA